MAVPLMLAGCIPAASPPAPPPVPAPPPKLHARTPKASVPAPPPPPRPLQQEPWDVAAVTTGDWSYSQRQGETVAIFAAHGQPAQLTLSCNLKAKRISLARRGESGGPATMTITTSAGVLRWPALPGADATGQAALVATRPASDMGFDWMAYSRGRFAVEVAAAARVIAPNWAEISRVIEDCRG